MTEINFTDRELDIMQVLWERGPATVADVQAALEDDLAYTTVLTMLRVLESKGHVGHETVGRAHSYHAVVKRETAGRSALKRLLPALFRGSPEVVLLHLVGDRTTSQEELRRMRDMLDAHLEEGGD